VAAADIKQRPKKVMPVSPGRPRGVPNKTTALLKDSILRAAEAAGGGDLAVYLQRQADENPGPFLALLGKVLPLQLTGANGGPIEIRASKEQRDAAVRAALATAKP
jgi:hypothetical protein